MSRSRLALRSWQGPPPALDHFPGEQPVLWLTGPVASPWLAGLREALQATGRLWAPQFHRVAVSDPLPGRSPWAWRPDRELPTRWSGDGAGDAAGEVGSLLEHRLADLPGLPEALAGAVLDGVLADLGAQLARVLCEQCAAVLREDIPYLLVEANGGSIVQVLRSLRRPAGGDGVPAVPGSVRTAAELRRMLELAGLGIVRASSLPRAGRVGRLAAAALGSAASPWLVVEGRKI